MVLSFPPSASIQPIFRKIAECPMQAIARRLERRIPLSGRVDLRSLDVRHPTQEGLTENVSSHGVRVGSSNPWKRNERLHLWSLPGDFRARARVFYCDSLGHRSFAIGVYMLASSGGWKYLAEEADT